MSMYDFVKIAISDEGLAKKLRGNSLLNFTTAVNDSTGELKNGVYAAEYKNLTFKIYPSHRIQLTGSLHKYWNEGEHNYNDFNLTNVREVLTRLNLQFGIIAETSRLENLEIGLNINTPFNPNIFLKNLIAYKQHPFSKMKVSGAGNGREVYLTQYGVKVYNKGLQYGQKDHILRFEKKVLRMQSLRKETVYLHELLKPAFAAFCHKELLNTYNDLIVNEPINETQLTKPERKLYQLALRVNSWEQMSRKQRHENRTRFKVIIQKYGSLNLFNTVGALLQKKGYVLTDIKKEKRERFYTSYIVEERYQTPTLTAAEKRCCISCGKDITRQGKNSKYCSPKFVGEKAAHKCRNANSNPRNNRERKIKRLETVNPLLFDIRPHLKTKQAV